MDQDDATNLDLGIHIYIHTYIYLNYICYDHHLLVQQSRSRPVSPVPAPSEEHLVISTLLHVPYRLVKVLRNVIGTMVKINCAKVKVENTGDDVVVGCEANLPPLGRCATHQHMLTKH